MRKIACAAGLMSAVMLGQGVAFAQTDVTLRVDKLEREMRAVQRKIFPGGNNQYFTPEITAPESPAGPTPGTPATTPVADLTARISALETQSRTMTGEMEQLQHRVQLLEDGFAAYKQATDTRLSALEGGAPGKPVAAAPERDVPSGSLAVSPIARPAPAPPAIKPVAADPARARLVAAVEKPTPTSDPAEDQYTYGYRLWQAKLYPEAEAQFKQVVAKYPKHRRASYAQNLLGRSLLDDNKPSMAALAFYDNYEKFKDGDRTPQSLYYLAQALKRLNTPPNKICQVYDELTTTYPDKIADMKADIAKGRAEANCK